MRWKYLSFIIVWVTSSVFGQAMPPDTIRIYEGKKHKIAPLIVPTALISYGFIGLQSQDLKRLNLDLKETIIKDNHAKFPIDDYAIYAPFVTVYALHAFGVQGKHSTRDASIILGTAYVVMGTTVVGLKTITNELRPDGTANNSFPSGHTATAFMAAEFLHQEYKDLSPWYGVAGYLVATGSGYMRMYNNRHWFTDVATGAGIGILSTKLAYWMYPAVNKKLFRKKENVKGMVLPFYNGQQYGVGLAVTF